MRGYSKLFCHVSILTAQTVPFHVKLDRVYIRRLRKLAEKAGKCFCKRIIRVFVPVIVHSNRF
jgi:hypothetical protein